MINIEGYHKWFDKWPGRVKFPQLLIRKEHHGNLYYLITDSLELRTVALQILKDQVDDGDYGEPTPPKSLGWESVEGINQLPEGKIKKHALELWQGYQEELKYYKSAQIEWSEVNQAIKEGDGKLAWAILSRNPISYRDGMALKPFSN